MTYIHFFCFPACKQLLRLFCTAIFYITQMQSPRQKIRQVEKSRIDLLHSGVRRNVPPEGYTKIFAKIPIAQPKRSSFLPNPPCDPQLLLQNQNGRLRTLIAELQNANAQLAGAASKQHKLQALLEKRLGNEDPTELSLEKAMEIKLMLEAEALQELLNVRQMELENAIRQQKDSEERLKYYPDEAEVELHAILAQKPEEVTARLAQKEQMLLLQKENIISIREKTQRLKQAKKIKEEELKQYDKQVEKGRECLPTFSKSTEENDSGIYGTQYRAKTTETLEREIDRLKEERLSFEGEIQQLMQYKVREKLLILKTIHQIQASMGPHYRPTH